jgi:hypothetical protein
MSLEATIRADFISKAEALLPAVSVYRWDGEEQAFNDVRAWPAVYISSMFMSWESSDEIGASDERAVTYILHPEVFIFVAAKDDAVLGYGEDQCSDMLETLRRGIIRKSIADIGYAELSSGFSEGRCQALIEARMGQFLYGQSWRITVFEESN